MSARKQEASKEKSDDKLVLVLSLLRGLRARGGDAAPLQTMSPTERWVLTTLVNYDGLDDYSPSIAELSRATGYDERTVRRTLRSLAGKGWVRQVERPGQVSEYAFDRARIELAAAQWQVELAARKEAKPALRPRADDPPGQTIPPGTMPGHPGQTIPPPRAQDPGTPGTGSPEGSMVQMVQEVQGGARAPHPEHQRTDEQSRSRSATSQSATPQDATPVARTGGPGRLADPAPQQAIPGIPPAPPSSARRRKASDAPASGVHEVIRHYVDAAERVYGARPATGGNQGGRIAKSAKDLLDAYDGDVARAIQAIDRALQDRRRPDIHAIARNPDGYGPLASAPAKAQPGRQAAPAGGIRPNYVEIPT